MRQTIIQPIVTRMSKKTASLEDLKILQFFHLCFNIVPMPKICLDFVENCIRFTKSNMSEVFNYWGEEIRGEISRWK